MKLTKEFEYRLAYSSVSWRSAITENYSDHLSLEMTVVASTFLHLKCSLMTFVEVIHYKGTEQSEREEILKQVTTDLARTQANLKELKGKDDLSKEDKALYEEILKEFLSLKDVYLELRTHVLDNKE